ncbi:Alpha/Beta hydrolase protein, partial [Elsinoe ampelina]
IPKAMPLAYDPEFLTTSTPLLVPSSSLPRPSLHDISTRRSNVDALRPVPRPRTPPDISHTTHLIPTTPPVLLHRFAPTSLPTPGPPASLPAILHIHGGGFITISVADAAPSLTTYVRETGHQIFSVDYRLSPETPFPGAIDDAWAALTWLRDHAGDFGVDASRIALFGESAGGAIAAGLAVRARDRGLVPGVRKLVLVYPMLDYRTVTNRVGQLATWSEVDNVTAWAAYLGRERYEGLLAGEGQVEGEASPAHVASVRGLPSMYLEVGQLDIFCEEDVRWAGRCVEEGVEVELHVLPGLPHGFEALGAGTKVVERSLRRRV